jgi:DNA-binding NtrC family response regulator
MSAELERVLDEVSALLGGVGSDEVRKLVQRARRLAKTPAGETERQLARYRVLYDLGVMLAPGGAPPVAQLLDGMLAIVEAQRGFVGMTSNQTWRLVAGRNIDRADIDDPEQHVSRWIIDEAIRTKEPVVSANASDAADPSASVRRLGLRSVACLPITDAGEVVAFVYVDDTSRAGLFDGAAIDALHEWLPLVGRSIATASRTGEREILPGVITRSKRFERMLDELSSAAGRDVSVLLTGETGTGKSFLARRLHSASPRARGPFVHVACGAIPESLFEAELFGSEPGAYTGATRRRTGRLEAANGGTFFLDELDSMPPSCQVKLLVALQERRIERLGSNASIPVDVRVIAAMGSDPLEAIPAGRLRQDLYYRLAVVEVRVPPLRDRLEDLPLLARHVLEDVKQRYRLPQLTLSEEALASLAAHDWPGNVRELENVLDRSSLFADDGVIGAIKIRKRDANDEAPGLVAYLTTAARHLVEVLQNSRGIQRADAIDAFRSLVVLEAVQRWGPEEAFAWLGLDSALQHRNHHRQIARERDRVEVLRVQVSTATPPASGHA